jgi:hypothetical protein
MYVYSLNCIFIFELSRICLWVSILTASGWQFIKKILKIKLTTHKRVNFFKEHERERVCLKKHECERERIHFLSELSEHWFIYHLIF